MEVVLGSAPGMSEVTQLKHYEGLIYSTAARYAPILDYDAEDVRQILRIKVWQAIEAYNARRGTKGLESFVFSCMRNRVKDLLKEQDRLNTRRNGGQHYIEDFTDDFGHFEGRYLTADCSELHELEEADLGLPSTLTEIEVRVVKLLVLDYRRSEIAVILGVSRQKVRAAHSQIRVKMADWSISATERREAASTSNSRRSPARAQAA